MAEFAEFMTHTSSTKSTSKSGSFRFFMRKRLESPPPEDLYGGYKSESQLYFTDTLAESKQFSLWFLKILTIVMWSVMINNLQFSSAMYTYLEQNVRCNISELEGTDWSFRQKQGISAHGLCAYYKHDYSLLAQKSYKLALNITRTTLRTVHVETALCDNLITFADGSEKIEAKIFCTRYKVYYWINIGEIGGILMLGFLADIHGRRIVILIMLPLMLIGCLGKYFCIDYHWPLVIFAVTAQIGLTTTEILVGVLVVEIVHYKLRPFVYSLLKLGWSVSSLFKLAIFTYFSHWDLRVHQLLINNTLLLPLCCQWLLPESPHWLVCNKKWDSMIKILQEMNYPGDNSYEFVDRCSEPVPHIKPKEILQILNKPIFRRHLVLGAFLHSLTTFLNFIETSTMLVAAASLRVFLIIEFCVTFVSVVIIPLFLTRMGRPVCISTCLLVLSLFYCVKSLYKLHQMIDLVIAIICHLMMYTSAFICHLLIIETFPTRVRCSALGICHALGILLVFIGSVVNDFTNIKAMLGSYGWMIYASLMVMAAFICAVVCDTGNTPLPDTELQAIIHF